MYAGQIRLFRSRRRSLPPSGHRWPSPELRRGARGIVQGGLHRDSPFRLRQSTHRSREARSRVANCRRGRLRAARRSGVQCGSRSRARQGRLDLRGGDAHETRGEAAAGEVVGKAGRIGLAGVCYLLFPRYSASDTSSNHLEPPPKPTLICTSCCAAAAPCQCTMFGAVYSLSPMPNSFTGFPRCCERIRPSSTMSSWPRSWLFHAVRAPCSKRRRATERSLPSIASVFPVKRGEVAGAGCCCARVDTTRRTARLTSTTTRFTAFLLRRVHIMLTPIGLAANRVGL